MADVIFWIVVAVVGLSLVAATLIIRYGKKELPPGEPREAIEAPQETPTEEEASPVAGEETPVAEEEPPVSELPEPEPTEPILDQPEEPRSRFARLRRRLASSNNVLARALGELLSVDRIDSETWDDFEATLIASDLGVGPTSELTEALRRELSIDGVSDPERARQVLRAELLKLVDPGLDRSLNLSAAEGDPAVVMVVGVNGTGKTTTVGKLARVLVAEGRSVMLGAADTFRAAAAEQLATWGERVGVETVSSSEGSDPASVAFDAVAKGKDEGIDVVLVDTAGRLHTKVGLMDELGKVKRVIEKKVPVTEVLLVLDATTGQNGMTQAKIFSEVVDVTGIVLTKLDGSAKGGIVIQVQRELGVPVKLVGLGEGVDDLAPFDPEGFVAGILGE